MTLNRRWRRNIKSNLSFYIACGVLTAVSLMLFTLFYIAGTGIADFGDTFFASQHCEDATFTTYNAIDDAGLAAYEQEYNVSLEREDYLNLTEGSLTVRLFRPTVKIDIYQVISGRDIGSDTDILLSAGWCENNNVNVGDKFTLNGREFTVCGTFLRPDYCSALVEPRDSYKNITTFVFGYVSESVFETLGDASCSYKVIYNDASKEYDFRRAVDKEYMLSDYVSKAENMRIQYVPEQAEMFRIMAWIFLFTLPLVTVALIGIILGRKVKLEKRMIGTLAALGYSRKQLCWHYVVLAMIPGLAGGALMTAFAVIFAQPYGSLCLADYEPLTCTFALPWYIAVIGIVVPTAIYMLKAYLTVHRLLRKPVTQLINNTAQQKKHLSAICARRHMRVKRKFSLRSLIGNPGRSAVVLLGIFLGAYIVGFSFVFKDSIAYAGKQSVTGTGKFQYEYVLNELGIGSPKEGEPALAVSAETDVCSFTLMGMDNDVTLWNTTLSDGTRADLDSGYYISSLMSIANGGLKAGDEVTFVNTLTLEEMKVTIAGVIQNDYVQYLLTSRSNLVKLFGYRGNFYNVILSDHALDLKASKIAQTVEASSLSEQADAMLDEMDVIIWSLTLIGAVICIAAVYVAVNLMMTENRSNIAMLGVLGLRTNEINTMLLNTNHVLLLPGIALGIFASVKTMGLFNTMAAQLMNMILPEVISVPHAAISAVIVAACYFVSLLAVRRKAANVDLAESLKDNRE